MSFAPHIPLQKIVADLTDGELLSQINPSIVGSERLQDQTILTLKNFGFRHRLISNCTESQNSKSWNRQCKLDTHVGDGGKFNHWKTDALHCTKSATQQATNCELTVEGQLKNLFIISADRLTVKAKYQALLNWTTLWLYTASEAATIESAKIQVERSGLLAKLDEFETQAAQAIKTPDYHFSYAFNGESDSARIQSYWAKNQSAQLYSDGEALSGFQQIVENAQDFIYGQNLVVACDESTEPLIQAIETKARSGVDVRLAVHKWFSILDFRCLNRLKNAGVAIIRGPFHASYLVNDQEELLIGSQGIAWTFFESDGNNGLDRDHMLYLKGANATDAVKDFAYVWNEFKDDKQDTMPIEALELKIKGEIAAGVRSPRSLPNACQFIAELPFAGVNSYYQAILQSVQAAKTRILFSGVRMGHLHDLPEQSLARNLFQELQSMASHQLEVGYIGNGRESGNGELTMELNQWMQSNQASFMGNFNRIVHWLTQKDAVRTANANYRAYQAFLKKPQLKVWASPEFIHYKTWLFDHQFTLVGSANLEHNAFSKLTEAAVLCNDARVVKRVEKALQQDLARAQAVSCQDFSNCH